MCNPTRRNKAVSPVLSLSSLTVNNTQPEGGVSLKRKHITVTHNYHDHATDAEPCLITPSEQEHRGGVTTPFPHKLHEMLERVEQDGFAHIVSWQPHGRCFVVHQPELFKTLLPRYFKLSKIASFQRQLNLYGFMRLTRGLDKGGYYHELFLRGKAQIASQIQRVKVKGTGVRAKSNPEQEPDFWAMPWVAPTTLVSSASSVVSEPEQTTNSCSVPYTASSVPVIEPLQQDIKLTGWGKAFYFLEDLGETSTTVDCVSSMDEDFLNTNDYDELVDQIFAEDQSFADLLEQIITC